MGIAFKINLLLYFYFISYDFFVCESENSSADSTSAIFAIKIYSAQFGKGKFWGIISALCKRTV